jgi:A/G-specific adenine glycosylase
MNFTDTILDWYASYGRDLPWRRTRDPYAIWLSEVILQQTRIAQGTAYWERFMERFPDAASLAEAEEDEVLRLWEGLGYYSRARNLHAAARQIAALGAFPDTLEGIKALKGIGDYTAAAIASIAFGIPAAVVDGNVYRVLARYFGISTPVGTTAAKKEFTALAQSLLPQERPGDFNQGMMDFGALQCTPLSPACLTCPLSPGCEALRTGRTASLPARKAGPAVLDRHFTYIYLRCGGRTAIHRREAGDIWQGLWEPFLLEHDGVPSFPEWTAAGRLTPLRKGVRHQLTHRTLHTDFYLFEAEAQPPLPEAYRWVPEAGLDRYAKPRLFELLLAELDKQNTPAI